MATFTLKYLIDILSETFQDTDTDESDRQVSESDWIDIYNVCVVKLITNNPEARTVSNSILLASGSKQSIPAQGIQLIDIIRNMGTDGETPGEAVTRTELEALQAFNRDWSTDTADDVTLNYMEDVLNPQGFYVYPPSDGTGYLLIKYSEAPDKVVYDSSGNWESTFIAVTDKFVDTLFDEMLAYAYKMDSDFPGNLERETASKTEALQGLSLIR